MASTLFYTFGKLKRIKMRNNFAEFHGHSVGQTSGKPRSEFLVLILVVIFSVLPEVAKAQEEGGSAEIDRKLELLYGRVVKNKNALEGLTNGVRSVKNNVSENTFALSSQADVIAETRQILDANQEVLSAIQKDLAAEQEKLSGMIQEQKELRQEIKSSLSQIKKAYMVAIGSGAITLVLALLLARSVVRKNKLDWYSLVKDALNAQQ